MADNFTTIQTNVANRVQDTSNEMKVLIATYINQRYKDIGSRKNWEIIDEDYSFPTESGTGDYLMPSDFYKEINVNDATNKVMIGAISHQQNIEDYANEGGNSTPTKYSIYKKIVSGEWKRYMRLSPTPAGIYTINVPYILSFDSFSGTEYPIIPCELALEYGATADAQYFKRQFAKAKVYEGLYEKQIQTLMWDEDNQPNLTHLLNVQSFNRDNTI